MKPKRLYSIYQIERLPNGKRRYHSASDMAFPLEVARRVFQSALIGSAFTEQPLELRPVESQKTSLRVVG